MEFSEKLEVCYFEMYKDYKLTPDQAKRIINDLDIEDIVLEYYEAEVRRAEQQEQEIIDYENEQNKKHYNDGWQDHIGG